MSPRLLVSVTLLASVVTFAPCSAEACTAHCSPAKFTAWLQTLPRGAQKLPLLVEDELITIAAADGHTVFVGRTNDGILDLGAPLAPGSYTLGYDFDECGGYGSPPRSFEVGKAARAPTSLGTLHPNAATFVAAARALTPEEFRGGCGPLPGERPAFVWRTVEWAPSTDMDPWVPLAYLVATVDGQRVGREGWGDFEGTHQYQARMRPVNDRLQVLHVAALCSKKPAGWDPSPSIEVGEGLHRVEIHGRIIDTSDEVPIASVDVDLRCTSTPGYSEAATDPNNDVGRVAGRGDDGAEVAGAGCACNASSSPRDVSPFAALGLIAIVGLGVRRRTTR